MEELKDIHGLDSISMWPLALGWKIVIILSTILITLLSIYLYKKIKFYYSWRYNIKNILIELKLNMTSYSSKQIADKLSFCLKTILIKEYGRKAAGGKSGSSMLLLLEDKDPNNFSWSKKGQSLLSLPYAPDNSYKSEDLNELIDASSNWIKRSYV